MFNAIMSWVICLFAASGSPSCTVVTTIEREHVRRSWPVERMRVPSETPVSDWRRGIAR